MGAAISVLAGVEPFSVQRHNLEPNMRVVVVMTGDEESILAATTDTCERAVAGLGDRAPVVLLTFSCSALRKVLGPEGTRRGIGRMATVGGKAPFAGFYTCGEIARTRGIDGFHNQTPVVLALG